MYVSCTTLVCPIARPLCMYRARPSCVPLPVLLLVVLEVAIAMVSRHSCCGGVMWRYQWRIRVRDVVPLLYTWRGAVCVTLEELSSAGGGRSYLTEPANRKGQHTLEENCSQINTVLRPITTPHRHTVQPALSPFSGCCDHFLR
ncbi:hypothetical protein BaRGS_00035223 [Batillaria attramentaria]|uniref:Secreted protein n=1 Tax=Batillaria attramentaria TaxID=370345 RepID=A0ABD0JFC1_9CAEN